MAGMINTGLLPVDPGVHRCVQALPYYLAPTPHLPLPPLVADPDSRSPFSLSCEETTALVTASRGNTGSETDSHFAETIIEFHTAARNCNPSVAL